MENDKRPILQKNRSVEQYYDTKSVASSTEMTGLTPTPPLSEDEEENFASIMGRSSMEGTPRDTKKRNK